jgi:hypothetical protein
LPPEASNQGADRSGDGYRYVFVNSSSSPVRRHGQLPEPDPPSDPQDLVLFLAEGLAAYNVGTLCRWSPSHLPKSPRPRAITRIPSRHRPLSSILPRSARQRPRVRAPRRPKPILLARSRPTPLIRTRLSLRTMPLTGADAEFFRYTAPWRREHTGHDPTFFERSTAGRDLTNIPKICYTYLYNLA